MELYVGTYYFRCEYYDGNPCGFRPNSEVNHKLPHEFQFVLEIFFSYTWWPIDKKNEFNLKMINFW